MCYLPLADVLDELGRKAETLTGIKKGDTVIVVAPGPRAEWESCMQRFKEQKVMRGTQG